MLKRTQFPLFNLILFMKKILLPLCVLFILFTSCRHTVKEYYPNGNLRSAVEYRGKIQDGLAVYFDEQGVKKMEVMMVRGKKEGRLRSFFFNGNLQTEEFYRNDLLNGCQTTYDKDGVKLSEIEFKDGIMDGSYKEWHDRDILKCAGHYVEGLWDGHWDYYDIRGFIIAEGDYVKGCGDQLNYTDTGVLYKKSHYENNAKNGEELYYNPEGNITKTILYKGDRMVSVDGNSVNL